MPAPTPPHIVRLQMAQLAEHMAEGGTVSGWARSIDMQRTQARRLWSRIVEGLGAQAR